MSLEFVEQSRLVLPHTGEELRLSGRIEEGEIVGLQGPSGCGKSTLLKHVAQVGDAPLPLKLGGLAVEDSGDADRKIALVFQKALLFPHLSVLENVRFPLQYQEPTRSWSRELQERRAAETLAEIGLQSLAARDVSSLSGGESMRVALARSLASTPRCLLLDEALAALDKETKAQIKSWLKNTIKEHRIPTLLVAHVQEDLEDFADRVVQWPASGSARYLAF